MDELTDLTEKLRTVRFAQQQFLIFWAMEEAVIYPGLDRISADLSAAEQSPVTWNSSTMLDISESIADEGTSVP